MNISSYVESLIYSIPAAVIAFSMHEFGHALVAHNLGDPTPEREGRLTINPKSHIDPFGLLLILIAGFGWARSVNTNPRYFKNPRRDQILVSLAGVGMNLVLAILFAIIISLIGYINLPSLIGKMPSDITFGLLNRVIDLNLILLVFNLLPIAPLDGFKVLAGILPPKHFAKISFLDRYGSAILMGLIFASMVNIPILSYLIGVPVSIIKVLIIKVFLFGPVLF